MDSLRLNLFGWFIPEQKLTFFYWSPDDTATTKDLNECIREGALHGNDMGPSWPFWAGRMHKALS